MAAGGPAALTVEDPGDDRIGIVGGQPADQSDGVFVGPHRWGIGARQADHELADRAAAPAQGEIGSELGPIDGDDDLFEQAAQQSLAVAIGCGWRRPHTAKIGTERAQRAAIDRGYDASSLLLAPG